MARLRLLHWKAVEAQPLLDVLNGAGHAVEYDEQFRTELLRAWRKDPPDAFVIDLSRLPSQGKEIAIALRQSPTTRRTPIVFCSGEQQKVASLQALLPDARYCNLNTLADSVKDALEGPPPPGTVPSAMMDRYRDRTAAQKLGIREGSTLALLEPPPHVGAVLGGLPAAVEVIEANADVTLCFLHDPDSARNWFSKMRPRAAKTKLWMMWQKKTSPGHAGVTEAAVRQTGLSLGLVDYKICSVDKDWSAMLFARKNAK